MTKAPRYNPNLLEEAALEKALALTKQQQHRDRLPSPMSDLNRHQLLEISTISLRIGFYGWCIGKILVGERSYEELFEEEGVGEGNGVMWFIAQKNPSPEEAINDLRDAIVASTKELMEFVNVDNINDLYIVLDKIHNYQLFAFSKIESEDDV